MVYPMGSYFDGRHNHNLTNNPYLNTLFEYQNATEDMLDFAPIGGGYGGYNANQGFLNDFIYPVTGQAAEHYRAGMATAANAGHGGEGGGGDGSYGPVSGLLKGTGQLLGNIPVVGGLFEGIGNTAGDLVHGLTFGLL